MSCASLSTLATSGGFDCEFVDSVPESLSCPICLLPFRDPHLLDCCGAKYCAVCIGKVKASSQPCPICKQQFNTILDKNDQRKILNLKVSCLKKSEGCRWEGELRRLNYHEEEECGWTLAVCRYDCGGHVYRYQLAEHEQNECPHRPADMKFDNIIKKYAREMEMMDKAHTAEMKQIQVQSISYAMLIMHDKSTGQNEERV